MKKNPKLESIRKRIPKQTKQEIEKAHFSFKHGGNRKGAGRKPKEPTKVIRVRVSKLEQILEINREP